MIAKKPIYNCGYNKNVKGRMISKNVLDKKRKRKVSLDSFQSGCGVDIKENGIQFQKC